MGPGAACPSRGRRRPSRAANTDRARRRYLKDAKLDEGGPAVKRSKKNDGTAADPAAKALREAKATADIFQLH